MHAPCLLVGLAACLVQSASGLYFGILEGTEDRRCFGKVPGSADRSSVTVRIPGRRWVSHYVLHSVVEILLKEYLGYTTEYLDAAHNPRDLARYAESDYDLDLEVWSLDQTTNEYEKYVRKEASVINPAPAVGIGYSGRAGLYTTRGMLAKSQFSDVFSFYAARNRATLKAQNFVMFGEDGLHEFLAEEGLEPFCVDEYRSCEPGRPQGYYIPPVCEARPTECAVLFRHLPSYDYALFEQMTRNHNLSLIHAWAGIHMDKHVKRLLAAGKEVVLSAWEPDTFPQSIDGVRINFPDHSYGCDSDRPWRLNGSIVCDFPEMPLQKLFSAGLLQKAPEAYMVLRSNVVVSLDQIRALIGLTQDAGGPFASYYEAACTWMKANPDIVAAWAPPCVVKPQALAFDQATFSCKEAAGFPVSPFTKTCDYGTQQPVGTADRSSIKVRVVRRSWLSHGIVSAITMSLLKDFLGYAVLEIETGDVSNYWAVVGELMEEGVIDIDAEMWLDQESDFYQTYVKERGTVMNPGPVGYAGRSGSYILPSTHQKSEWTAWWRFYDNRTNIDGYGLNFLRFGYEDPDVPSLQDWRSASGNQPPVPCNAEWCSAGQFEGFWVPPQCEADPRGCLLHVHAVSWYDPGYFEALTASRGHPFIHAYYGWGLEAFVTSLQANGTYDLLFYGWEPDAIILRLGAIRLSYPDYNVGCDANYDGDPHGHVVCDYSEVVLQKYTTREFRTRAPESYFMLTHLHILRREITAMMSQHTLAGGALTDVYDIGCKWIRDNLARVQATAVPDCISKPKAPGTERLGDFIFNPNTVSCIQVACRPDEVLDVSSGSVCRKCSEGLLPNEESTQCVPCRAGATPNRTTGQCDWCPLGSYCTYGAELPAECPSGTYAGVTGLAECVRCGLGSFQSLPGQSECQPCPEYTTTPGLGSRYEEECLCPEGFYKPDTMGAQGVPDNSSSTQACLPCPASMECQQGSDMANAPCVDGHLVEHMKGAGPYPVPRVQYYTECAAPLSVYKCITETACPGGHVEHCSSKYAGIACGGCQSGWYLSGVECDRCWGVSTSKIVVPLLFLIAGPVAVPIMYLRKRDTMSQWNTPSNHMAAALFVALIYIQTIAAVSACYMQPTLLMHTSTHWTKYALNLMSVLKPECALLGGFFGMRVLNLLSPLYTAVIFMLVYLGSVCSGWARRMMRIDGDLLSNCYWSLFNTFFMAICRQTLELFQCYDHPNGKRSLRSQSDVLCYSTKWDSVVVPSLVAVVVFCGGFIALNAYIMWVAPQRYHEPTFQKRWKFVFARYRPTVWWWGLTVLLKGVWLNLPAVIFHRGAAQLVWVEAALVVYLVTCITLFPWRGFSVGVLDMCMHTFLVGVIPLLYFFADPAPDEKERHGIGRAYAFFSMAPLVVAACILLLLSLKHVGVVPSVPPQRWRDCSREACQTLNRLVDEDKLAPVIATLPWFDVLRLQSSANLLQSLVFLGARPMTMQRVMSADMVGSCKSTFGPTDTDESDSMLPRFGLSTSTLGTPESVEVDSIESCPAEHTGPMSKDVQANEHNTPPLVTPRWDTTPRLTTPRSDMTPRQGTPRWDAMPRQTTPGWEMTPRQTTPR